MKVVIINRQGAEWEFKSVKAAKPHIKKNAEYRIEKRDDKKVRVYDDREL